MSAPVLDRSEALRRPHIASADGVAGPPPEVAAKRIRSTRGAHNALLDLEELDPEQLDEFRLRYERLAEAARNKLQRGISDTGTPDCLSATEASNRPPG